jgi:hypothetical protein
VVDAHEILVMEAGRIIERGTHAELLALRAATPACGRCSKAASETSSPARGPGGRGVPLIFLMNPTLLVLHGLSEGHRAQLAQSLDLIYAPTPAERAAAVAAHGERVQIVLTIGSTGLTAAEMDAMPRLGLVCALGAGYENIDAAHARQRGVVVANGAGTNEDCVADHAMGLLLAQRARHLRLDRQTREGVWRDAAAAPNVSGRRLGLLGLGGIGRKIARRAEGFDIEMGYHNRRPRGDVAYRYFDQLGALAEWADFLVVATPGGRHAPPGRRGRAAGPGPRGTLVISRAAAWSTPPPWPPRCARPPRRGRAGCV